MRDAGSLRTLCRPGDSNGMSHRTGTDAAVVRRSLSNLNSEMTRKATSNSLSYQAAFTCARQILTPLSACSCQDCPKKSSRRWPQQAELAPLFPSRPGSACRSAITRRKRVWASPQLHDSATSLARWPDSTHLARILLDDARGRLLWVRDEPMGSILFTVRTRCPGELWVLHSRVRRHQHFCIHRIQPP